MNNNNNQDWSSISKETWLKVADYMQQEQSNATVPVLRGSVKCVGIDYGLARTGVAVSVGYQPQPVAIWSETNLSRVVDLVVDYCQTEKANRIVVGLPLHKNGTIAEQTEITLRFTQQLAVRALQRLGPNVPIHLWDERYTSKLASARLHGNDADNNNNNNNGAVGTLDAEAACIILEDYYNHNGEGAPIVQVEDPILREECLQLYQSKQEGERERLLTAQREREERIQRRKDAIAKGAAEAAAAATEGGDDDAKSKKKKKKKKNKR